MKLLKAMKELALNGERSKLKWLLQKRKSLSEAGETSGINNCRNNIQR